MHAGRTVMAMLVSLVAIPIGIWAALVAALALVQGLFALFMDVHDAPWTSVLNPVVWLGAKETGRASSILDDLLGGPSAPNGSVSPLLTCLVGLVVAILCLLAVTWAWDQTRVGRRI
jgi:hypothetical protein